jgi:hypothetical protein
MSLNSLQDDMSRRAASMAAMAKRATRPDEIQAIQKSLIAGVQSGAIKAYVGIPLIQELTNKITEAKAKMAQAVTGAGMPQPPQGGAPIAQQVMAQAGRGVETLSSNLPESYAGGGIIAFEDGGQVERYQNTGYTGESERKRAEEAMAKLRTYGLRQRQQDPQGYIAAEAAAKEAQNALSNIERSITGGPAGAMGQSMGIATPPVVAPTATPAASNPIIPYGQSRANILGGETAPPPPPPAAPVNIGFKMPTLQTYTPTTATLPERTAPVLQDLNSFVKGLPENAKKDAKTAVDLTQKTLEDMDRPGFEAREERLGKREAGLERENAISRALTGIKTGLRVAGSKERTLAGALGNEGSQGIEDLIRGEAANRAAKDKLEDYRDNLEQQKVASKKGNYQAAQAAGERAADNLYKYTNLNLNAASAGNSQALQRQQIEQTGDIGKAGVLNQGEQLKLSAIDQQNRNQLGIAQLQATTASANAQLQLGREKLGILKDQIAAGNERARATLVQAENKAASTWQSSPQYQQAQAQAKKMAPIEAQRFMQNSWLQYKENMLPSLMGGGGANIPSFADAMKAME